MSDVLYFIEKDGVRRYKTDSFWSKSVKLEYAKIHSDSISDQVSYFKSLCMDITCLEEYMKPDEQERKLELYDGYEGALYGYQKILSKRTGIYLDPDCKLGDPVYLNVILDVTHDGKFRTLDYKSYLRNVKLKSVLNEI